MRKGTRKSMSETEKSSDDWVRLEDANPVVVEKEQFEKDSILEGHPDVKVEEVAEFPEEWKRDFEGLAYLGQLTMSVKIPFHTFVLKTLLPIEKLEVSLIASAYENTLGYAKSFKAAIVAASLVTVDDRAIITGEKQRNVVRQKYEYVVNTWYEPIIDLLYNATNALELRSLTVLEAMGVLGEGGSLVRGEK